MNRRGLITGLIAFTATAPAIVRVQNLMALPPRRPLLKVSAITADGRRIPMLPWGNLPASFSTSPFDREALVTGVEFNVGGRIVRKPLEQYRNPLTGDTLVGHFEPKDWARV